MLVGGLSCRCCFGCIALALWDLYILRFVLQIGHAVHIVHRDKHVESVLAWKMGQFVNRFICTTRIPYAMQ